TQNSAPFAEKANNRLLDLLAVKRPGPVVRQTAKQSAQIGLTPSVTGVRQSPAGKKAFERLLLELWGTTVEMPFVFCVELDTLLGQSNRWSRHLAPRLRAELAQNQIEPRHNGRHRHRARAIIIRFDIRCDQPLPKAKRRA